MSRENIQTLLERIGTKVGINNLALDKDDLCQLLIDGQISLEIEYLDDSQTIVFTTRCGLLPAAPLAMLQIISDANHYWAGTGGGTLSTNSAEGAVYLQYREACDQLDQPRLESLLQAVIHNTEAWMARLAAAQDHAPQTDAAAEKTPEASGGYLNNLA